MALRLEEDDPSLNPGQIHADRQFNGLKNAEENGNSQDKPEGNNSSDTDDIDTVKNAEDNPNSDWENNVSGEKPDTKKAGGRFSFIKKKGPLTTIVITVLGGGIGIGALLSPGLLLVHMKEVFTERLNDAAPALSIRTNKMLYGKFNDTKNAFAESSDGKCGIKCRLGSMNTTLKNNLEAKGFKIVAEEGTGLINGKGRWTIKSLTFPESSGIVGEITTGKDFAEAMKDPARASVFKKVFNSKTAYFLNSKFGLVLREKFGLNKLSELTSRLKSKVSDTTTSVKDKISASMREIMGLPPVDVNLASLTPREKILASGKYSKTLAFIDGPVTAAGAKVTDILSGVCATYNVARGVTYAAKIGKIAAFASFAMIWLNAADQLKAGDGDSDINTALTDQLTQVDSNGMSATDSLGYKIAAYGDTSSGSETDRIYSAAIGSTAAVGILATITIFLGKGGKAAMDTARTACRAAANPAVAVATSCPEEILAAAATGLETVGVGAIISAVACVGKMAIIATALGGAISLALSGIIPALANGEIPLLDENTIGSALGDSLYTGTTQIFGGASASYGLSAGNQEQIKQYAIDSAAIKKQEDAIASYDAKATPFDIYNQYSFLGSIVQKLGIISLYNSSFATSIGKFLSIIPKSFATLTNSAAAEAETKSAQYGQCTDGGLEQIGIVGDAFCNPSYVMSSSELNSDMYQVADYMINNGFIDKETGEVIDNPSTMTVDPLAGTAMHIGNDYKLYLDNCANRTDPLGETSTSIESPIYDWAVGTNCVISDNSSLGVELSNFRAYTMDKAISDTMDES